jgi:hypothetical protein
MRRLVSPELRSRLNSLRPRVIEWTRSLVWWRMARYRVHFVDHVDNIYDAVHIEHEDDEAAVEHAHRINVPNIGGGFEVWEGDRLVDRHRN